MAPVKSAALAVLTLASCVSATEIIVPRAGAPYAPQPTTCPSGSLVRSANGLSSQESDYVTQRNAKAADSLKTWLTKIDPTYANATDVPVLALTHSGGGLRAFLIAAGVTQALDSRDGSGPLAGLLQSLTYQAGLSGGSWFIGSMFGNNYPTVSDLQSNLWTAALAESLFLADLFDLNLKGNVATDTLDKLTAGFPVGLTDPWGRLLSYQFLLGPDGGVVDTYSGIANSGNFTSHNIPFPIITSVGVETFAGACSPADNATIYEYTPYEFGSWGPGVSAFTPMNTLGSTIKDGASTSCVSGFDNLGFAFGTSSSLFFELLRLTGCSSNTTLSDTNGTSTSDSDLQAIVNVVEDVFNVIGFDVVDPLIFATYPNPFYGHSDSTLVSGVPVLSLVDGGTSNQNDPINPFIQPARDVDVLFVNDNSADLNNFPDGFAIWQTYQQSKPGNLSLPKMPEIPDPSVFLAEGLNTRPTVFGCNDASKTTMVYLPNYDYTYPSNTSTFQLEYLPDQTAGMIKNGNAVATRNDDKEWPACLACVLMKKTNTTLPSNCDACFKEYCYN